MEKTMKKVLALLLTALLTVNALPSVRVFALEGETEETATATTETVTEEATQEDEDTTVLAEDGTVLTVDTEEETDPAPEVSDTEETSQKETAPLEEVSQNETASAEEETDPAEDLSETAESATPSESEVLPEEKEEAPVIEEEKQNKKVLKNSGPLRAPAANLSTVYVSASGNDESGDGSEDNPFATMDKAYEAAQSGAVITLLSDIEMSRYVYIKHDVTIDGQGHTITRAEGFASASDTGRSWYNPSMFELHADDGNVTVTFKNVTIDEGFKHEGSVYKFQSTSDTSDNTNRVQDGIISAYHVDDSNKSTVILEEGTKLLHFGGMTAVRVQGNCELVMKSGSLISNDEKKETAVPDNSGEAGAVTTQNGIFTMEAGSTISGIKGVNAVTSNSGTINIDGEITKCNSGAMIRPMGLTKLTLGENSKIHDVTNVYCVIYGNSCAQGTVFNIGGKIYDVSCGLKRGGIWPSNSGSNITINILETAEFYNIPGQVLRSDGGTTINMSGGKIHDSGIAQLIRKYAELNFTGGEISKNTFGVLLANDGTVTAKINVLSADENVHDNTYDYFIDYSENGYKNGSYMYFSTEKLAENPVVHMGDMNPDNYKADVPKNENYRVLTIPSSNGFMYLGNASKPSKTTLDSEAGRLNLTNKRAYWWFTNDSDTAEFDVSEIPNLSDEPLFALHVPVAADGKVADGAKVMCTPVTVEDGVAKVKISAAKSETGYSILLAQAEPETVKVTIHYLDEDGNSIKDDYSEDYVKGSNYDVKTFAEEEIEGYEYKSTEGAVSGEDLEADLELKSYYTTIKQDIEPKVTLDDWTYGDKAKDPSVDGNTGNGEVTYTYYKADENGEATGEPLEGKPSEAGDYVVKADVAETAKYNSGSATDPFKIEKATVTFASENEEYGTVSILSVKIGKDSDKLSSKATAKKGYHFVNWTDKDGKVVDTAEELKPERKAGSYTAHFKADTHTVSFDSDGGDKVSSQTVEYNKKASKPSDPKKDGYSFEGWYQGDKEYDFSAPVTSDVKLKAKWKAVPKPTPTPVTPKPTPQPTPAPAPTPTPQQHITPSVPVQEKEETPKEEPAEEPKEEPVEEPKEEPVVVPETDVPTTVPEEKTWALVNLLTTIGTVLTGLGMLLTYFRGEDGNRKGSKFLGLIPAIASVVAFALTENMSNPMTWTDKWTPLMFIPLVLNGLLAVLTRNKTEE